MKTVGAAVVIRWQDRYVFEIQKKRKWRKRPQGLFIGVGCIGGRVEPGESPKQALMREIAEEIKVDVELEKQEKTYLVRADGRILAYDPYTASQKAWFSWLGRPPYAKHRILAYYGKAKAEPIPEDVGGVLITSLETLFEGFQDNWSLGRWKQVAKVIEKNPIPNHAQLEPKGTVEVLGELIANGFISIY